MSIKTIALALCTLFNPVQQHNTLASVARSNIRFTGTGGADKSGNASRLKRASTKRNNIRKFN